MCRKDRGREPTSVSTSLPGPLWPSTNTNITLRDFRSWHLKPHTRQILDFCTNRLAEMGGRRVRRGLVACRLNDQMLGAIALQHREFADGNVWIDTYPQIYWQPVQRIYCAGTGQEYSATRIPTRSRMWSLGNVGEPQLSFHPAIGQKSGLERLAAFVKRHAIPKVLELADERSIENFYLEEAPRGGHRPEMYLAIKAWQTRSVLLDKDFTLMCSVVNRPEVVDSLTEFYRRLKAAANAIGLSTANQ